jgi:hypothetical protein
MVKKPSHAPVPLTVPKKQSVLSFEYKWHKLPAGIWRTSTEDIWFGK